METPTDLCNRLKTAAASLTDVKTNDFMHKVIILAVHELLLETATWIDLLDKSDTALLRAALVGLLGAGSKDELRQMAVAIQASSAPAHDKVVALNAINALLQAMP